MGIDESVDDPADPSAELEALVDLGTPFAVRVAATLNIADLIASGVDTVDGLAEACEADRDALARLLRFLTHRRVFTESSPGVFGLTPVGRLLCASGPGDKRTAFEMGGVGVRMDLAFAGLLHSIRTGEPGYASVHGRSLWADLDAEPSYRAYFDDLMRSQQLFTAPQVASLYDWSTVKHVMDIGGGSGQLLTELLLAHPHLRGAVVDRPEPVRAAVERFAAAGLADRAEAIAGDFFEPLPTGAEVYIVSRALTDWNDRSALAILRRCAEAAGTSGRVLVVEMLPTHPYVPHQSSYDLKMLAVVGGRERGADEHIALAAAAGLTIRSVSRGTGGLIVMEFTAGDGS